MSNEIESTQCWGVFGHCFRDFDLLRLAVTPRHEISWPNNDRLEFLGDSVLQAATALFAYQKAPNQNVGYLSGMAVQARTNEYLSLVCLAYDFNAWRRKIRPESTDLQTEKQRADLVESLLGAIFLDGGWDALLQAVTTMLLEVKPVSNDETADATRSTDEGAGVRSDSDGEPGADDEKRTRQSKRVPFPTVTVADVEAVKELSKFEPEISCGSCKAALQPSAIRRQRARSKFTRAGSRGRISKLSKRATSTTSRKNQKRESRKDRFLRRQRIRAAARGSPELEQHSCAVHDAETPPSPPLISAKGDATLSSKARKVAKWKEWRKECRKSIQAKRAKKKQVLLTPKHVVATAESLLSVLNGRLFCARQRKGRSTVTEVGVVNLCKQKREI